MKTLNITFDDKDFRNLASAKKDYEADTEKSISWERFILKLLEVYEK